MKKSATIILVLLLTTMGCSNEATQKPLSTEDKEQIEDQKSEIQKLKDDIKKAKLEVEKYKNDLSSYNSTLTLLDENARTIMGQIKEEKFEEIKRDYNIKFDIRDNNIVFEGLEDFSFPIKLLNSESPIFISYINLEQPEIAEIFYIVDTDDGERYRFGLTFERKETLSFKKITLIDN